MISTPVLVDTGPLVALLSDRDPHHSKSRLQADQLAAGSWTCWPVVTEAAYLLRHSRDAVTSLLDRLDDGVFRILPMDERDVDGIRRVLGRFHDQEFDFADACLMHLAEREGIRHVFTLDRRHFGVFRMSTNEALVLLPD